MNFVAIGALTKVQPPLLFKITFIPTEFTLKSHSFAFRQRFVKVIPSIQNTVILNETFEEKNARLKRPLSPHLSIYKPQITSMLSITHRITGFVLFGYMMGIVGCNDPTKYLLI